MQQGRWAIVLAAAVMLATACGGGGPDGDESAQRSAAAVTETAVHGADGRAMAPGTPTATRTADVLDYKRLEKYLPTDAELPDRVAYAAKFDLSNEKATSDPAQVKQFQDTGRLTGIQAVFSIDAGTRTIQFGISYYNNTDEPRKLLRRSGDPANHTGPNRFQIPDLGDEYIAQRTQFGSGKAVINNVNIAWVRGPFFIGLADIGGDPDKPVDIAVAMAQLIDGKLKASPTP